VTAEKAGAGPCNTWRTGGKTALWLLARRGGRRTNEGVKAASGLGSRCIISPFLGQGGNEACKGGGARLKQMTCVARADPDEEDSTHSVNFFAHSISMVGAP
jgi:hypothetical protein